MRPQGAHDQAIEAKYPARAAKRNEFDGAPSYPSEDIRQALAISADVPIMSIDARVRDSAKQALIALTQFALQRLSQPTH